MRPGQRDAIEAQRPNLFAFSPHGQKTQEWQDQGEKGTGENRSKNHQNPQ
jgi:hypothetical protein